MRGQNMSYITIDCLNDDDLNFSTSTILQRNEKKMYQIFIVSCVCERKCLISFHRNLSTRKLT